MNNNSWFKKERPLLGLFGLTVGGAGSAPGGPPIEGSGGYVSEYASGSSPTGYYRTHVFVAPGRFRVTTAPGDATGNGNFSVLTVGAGGAGGPNNGGGGGSGAFILQPEITAATGNYPVEIGDGGRGRFNAAFQAPFTSGGQGGDTKFTAPGVTITAGGGGGGNRYMNSGYGTINEVYTPVDLMNARDYGASSGGGGYGPSPGFGQSGQPGGSSPSVPAPMGTGFGNAGGQGGSVNVCAGGGGAGGVGQDGGNSSANAPGAVQGKGGIGKTNNWATGSDKYFAAGGGGSANLTGTGITPNDAKAGNGGAGGGGGGGCGGPGNPSGALTNQGDGGGNGGIWDISGSPGLNTSVPTAQPYYNNNNFMGDPNGNPGYANIGGSAAFMTGSGGGGGGGGCAVTTYTMTWGKQVSGGNGSPGICMVRYAVDAPAATGTATGGLISETPTHRIHTFLGPGTFVTSPTFNGGSDQSSTEIVAVGGGGSGGAHFGGGGGAGRYYTGTLTIKAALSYTITVGQGGDGGFNGPKIPGVEGTETLINSSPQGTQVYCGGGGGGGTRDGGPTIDQGWPGQGPTFSRGSGGGAGAGYNGGVGSGGSGPGTNNGGAYSSLLAGGGGGSGGVGQDGSNPTQKSGHGGPGTQIPTTFRDSTTCVFGAKGPGSSEDAGSSWGWFAGGGGGAGGYPSGDIPTGMPKFGGGGGSPQPNATTLRQPASYAGGGAGSGWGGPTSYSTTADATASDPYYGRGKAQSGLCGTGGGGGGFGPEGFTAGQGSGPGGPGILILAYPKTS